jgi:hypothetical protein
LKAPTTRGVIGKGAALAEACSRSDVKRLFVTARSDGRFEREHVDALAMIVYLEATRR